MAAALRMCACARPPSRKRVQGDPNGDAVCRHPVRLRTASWAVALDAARSQQVDRQQAQLADDVERAQSCPSAPAPRWPWRRRGPPPRAASGVLALEHGVQAARGLREPLDGGPDLGRRGVLDLDRPAHAAGQQRASRSRGGDGARAPTAGELLEGLAPAERHAGAVGRRGEGVLEVVVVGAQPRHLPDRPLGLVRVAAPRPRLRCDRARPRGCRSPGRPRSGPCAGVDRQQERADRQRDPAPVRASTARVKSKPPSGAWRVATSTAEAPACEARSGPPPTRIAPNMASAVDHADLPGAGPDRGHQQVRDRDAHRHAQRELDGATAALPTVRPSVITAEIGAKNGLVVAEQLGGDEPRGRGGHRGLQDRPGRGDGPLAARAEAHPGRLGGLLEDLAAPGAAPAPRLAPAGSPRTSAATRSAAGRGRPAPRARSARAETCAP